MAWFDRLRKLADHAKIVQLALAGTSDPGNVPVVVLEALELLVAIKALQNGLNTFDLDDEFAFQKR